MPCPYIFLGDLKIEILKKRASELEWNESALFEYLNPDSRCQSGQQNRQRSRA